MTPTGPLLFLLAPVEALGPERLDTAALNQAQDQGVSSAFALRIVVTADLAGSFNRVCDAITPRFEPDRLWLAVYRQEPSNSENLPSHWLQIDRFPLCEAINETCWFYPTHDGHYLGWQRDLAVTLGPGQIGDPPADLPASYNRGEIALLWSLLADATSLTCVGLTYAGRRIDWPLRQHHWADTASWSHFSVDGSREVPLVVHSRQLVGGDGPAEAFPAT